MVMTRLVSFKFFPQDVARLDELIARLKATGATTNGWDRRWTKTDAIRHALKTASAALTPATSDNVPQRSTKAKRKPRPEKRGYVPFSIAKARKKRVS